MDKLSTLDFLIPTYKRPKNLIEAVKSVARQIQEAGLEERVKIKIVDDCSPNFKIAEVSSELAKFSCIDQLKQNLVNKGMSLNIRDMVKESSADFCTILTDDDKLQFGSLVEIVSVLDELERTSQLTIGSFFVPRYSYLEDGSLHCVVCKPFEETTLITSSSVNSIRHLQNGFILTGLFFKPKLINFQLWDANIDNGFFPVIYFADLLLSYDCLFLNCNWFVHTVLNECHWDAWGKTQLLRESRLYDDYMQAVSISAQRASLEASNWIQDFQILDEEYKEYKRQIHYFANRVGFIQTEVHNSVMCRIAYKGAILWVKFFRLKERIRLFFSRFKHLIIKPK